jgi:hypothetical protein
VLEAFRIIDGAIDQYAIESNKAGGASVAWADVQNYLKTSSAVYASNGNDIFGNTYGTFTVDSIPKVSASTFNALSDVAPAAFWSPYK